jgi:hypothetical protein
MQFWKIPNPTRRKAMPPGRGAEAHRLTQIKSALRDMLQLQAPRGRRLHLGLANTPMIA